MSLEFRLNRPEPTRADVDCVVVGLFADGSLSAAGTAIDKAAGGRLSNLAKRGDLSGKTGRTAMLHDLDGVKAPRVLVVGLGESGKFGAPQFQKAVNDAVRALRTGPACGEVHPGRDWHAWHARHSTIEMTKGRQPG